MSLNQTVVGNSSTKDIKNMDPLNADRLHAELVQECLKDESLHPLLPLLGYDGPVATAETSQSGTGLPNSTNPAEEVRAIPFNFPNTISHNASLEDWEVQQVVSPKSFKNWVVTVNYEPAYLLLVRSLRGVREVIKWAATVNKKVRVAGFRHTWAPLYSSPEDIIITFVPPVLYQKLPYEDPPSDFHSELQGVSIVESVGGVAAPPNGILAKVMAGTTNTQFRHWCHDHDNGSWALPFNTVVLAVTMGGTNATICHGGGLSTSTLSDLVVEVCYVDAHGNDQRVSDPQELKAAAGCFGLLGVVTSITLQMESMTIAEMRPTQVPVAMAIPPPAGYLIPQVIQDQMREANISEDDLARAKKEWIRRCEEDHFHEWFWFPFQKNAWVNTWRRRPKKPEDSSLPRFPDFGIDDIHAKEAYGDLSATISSSKTLSGPHQAYAFGIASLASLPNVAADQPSISAYISEGIHFRGGTQLFPFWGMEWELPIRQIDGRRDYEAIQRAWWDGISAIYSRPDAPVRAALEMRLTGGSSIILAPQRHNVSTASVEIFTHLTTPLDQWRNFRQLVVDRWTSYKDNDGKLLNARPHWAKHWWDLEVHGQPIREYLKQSAYREAFEEFRSVFSSIVERRGSTVEETRERFEMDVMGRLVFG